MRHWNPWRNWNHWNTKKMQHFFAALFGLTTFGFWSLALRSQWVIETTRNADPFSSVAVWGIFVSGCVLIFGGGFGAYRAMKSHRENLLKSIQMISQTAHEAAGSAEKAKQATGDLSKHSNDYGSSLQETVSAVEELTATVEKNSDSAKKVAELAHTSLEATKKGALSIEKMVFATTVIFAEPQIS
ncbi:hypothetical protein WDW86_02865 [Bdellovibrionota bacterium FG-2]